jgi:hypothetical protein
VNGTLSNLVFSVNQAGAVVLRDVHGYGRQRDQLRDDGPPGKRSCQILELTLGPLDLDLLGLMVAPRHRI